MIQNDYRLVLRSSGPELFCALFSDLNLKISLSFFQGLTGINLCPIRICFVSDSFPALIFPCLSLRLLERKGKKGERCSRSGSLIVSLEFKVFVPTLIGPR